jgi:hypothetical protein
MKKIILYITNAKVNPNKIKTKSGPAISASSRIFLSILWKVRIEINFDFIFSGLIPSSNMT